MDIFCRVMITEPATGSYSVSTWGHRHERIGGWNLPAESWPATAGAWTPWHDLSSWPWHGRLDRSGGLAEWPSMRLTVNGVSTGSTLRVQLATAAGDASVVHDFTESSETNLVYVLVPDPLPDYAG